jgi:serine/threonine-protein kinase RIM15
MADLVVSDNKTVFLDAMESMKTDDSRSHRVRFAMALGPLSKLAPVDDVEDGTDASEAPIFDLEAQGIIVYDTASGGESHVCIMFTLSGYCRRSFAHQTCCQLDLVCFLKVSFCTNEELQMMWMIRPWIAPREIQIDLPSFIVDSLGSGAEILASHLTQLAESGFEDPEHHPPPLPVLCRICERHIPPWWFEKHTDLCLQEHRAEMDVQMAQEALTEHRHAIVKVLDALDVRASRSLPGDLSPLSLAEYKGMPIGPPPSTQSSPGSSSAPSRERSGPFAHSRTRSFAIRRPQARIVELLMDLCDTALEISTPAIKDAPAQGPGEFRTQSPQSESRVSQVMQ